MNVVKPNRVSHTYAQQLSARPERVFALLCPVREADVTYTHTSLGPQGDAFVASFTEGHYRQFMQDWESQLNRYLLQSADPVPR